MLGLSYSLETYPFRRRLYQFFDYYQLLKIDLGIEYRSKLNSNSYDLFIGNFLKASIGLNFYLGEAKKQSIGLAYSYQDGGNPLKGLPDKVFNQLAIIAKVNHN